MLNRAGHVTVTDQIVVVFIAGENHHIVGIGVGVIGADRCALTPAQWIKLRSGN